jgi:hypothetical protein
MVKHFYPEFQFPSNPIPIPPSKEEIWSANKEMAKNIDLDFIKK